MRKLHIFLDAAVTLMLITYSSSAVETEVKVGTSGERVQFSAGTDAFKAGEVFYNAIPSTAAQGQAIKVIETGDDTDFICKAYELKSQAIGAEIASFIRSTVEKENGTVDVSVNTKTGKEYLIVTGPIFQFAYLDEVIKVLDSEGTKFYEDGTKLESYKLKNRLASDIAGFVETALMSKDGAVYADDRVNMLYIIDSPSYFDGTLDFVKKFDVPPEMVRIEAEIIEIELDDDFNFGLALEAWKEALPENIDMTIDWSHEKSDPGAGPAGWAQYVAQNVELSGMRPKAVANFINYLVRTGKATVLSRPTVVAMNGQEANIASLDNINYKAYSTPEEPLEKRAQLGVELAITPTIGADTLSLAINASVNSVVGWSSGGTPIVNTRKTTANVVLSDGELFSLSGLRKDMVTKTDERVPILGYIPLVGYFFRHEIDVKKTSEIVVLLTPTKVTPSESMRPRDTEIREQSFSLIEEKEASLLDSAIDSVILNKKP